MSARKKKGERPAGEIRLSQMVGTYGPGSMVDLLDHAVLVGGIDYWNYPARVRPVVHEPRLREKLVERLRGLDEDLRLSLEGAFRLPPAAEERSSGKWNGVQALEFPAWFVCQNPSCRGLERRNTLERKKERYVHGCTAKGEKMVPVRFVAACPNGHLQDFPWISFTHQEAGGSCHLPKLRLDQGTSGDFSEIRVSCKTCGASQPLSQASLKERAYPCRGERPWLGQEAKEACDHKLRLLVRTASNAYFAQVESALSIPDPAKRLEDAVRAVWDVLKDAELEDLPFFRRKVDKVKIALDGFADPEVVAAIESVRSGQSAPRLPLRTAEMVIFRGEPEVRPGELPAPEADYFARAYEPPAGRPAGVSRLVLMPKLREVRVQVGFTRLEPVSPDLQGEYDLGVGSQRLGLHAEWLPAGEVRGEGFLIELDEEAIHAWERRPAVMARDEELRAGFETWKQNRESKGAYPGIRYYLLHSLSHLMIQALSLHCGYPASAIRERIYCDAHDAEVPMAGILLLTGSSGTEGTLGGLVEEGRRIDRHLRRALENGLLCANDPVCGAHSPRGDYAERFLEGAACHGCLYVAEPCCERFNLFLDRALVVPTLGQDPSLAFFAP